MMAERVSTFSIVARAANGDLGVAVASRYFAVGSVVPWAEAEVGAVATQANVNVGFGPRGLELLREGMSAAAALDRLREEDNFEGNTGRQVAIVDAKGGIAVHTGSKASAWAGHAFGQGWSVQGNILRGPRVLEVMSAAFEKSEGELAEKLYAALRAGDSAGGDSRGKQSAALLVVRKQGGRNINNDCLVSIRVDDHPKPLDELSRLLNLNQAYLARNRSYERLGAGNPREALDCAARACQLAPDHTDVRIYLAFLHYLAGEKTAALEEFRQMRQADDNFNQLWQATLEFRARFKAVLQDEQFVRQVFSD